MYHVLIYTNSKFYKFLFALIVLVVSTGISAMPVEDKQPQLENVEGVETWFFGIGPLPKENEVIAILKEPNNEGSLSSRGISTALDYYGLPSVHPQNKFLAKTTISNAGDTTANTDVLLYHWLHIIEPNLINIDLNQLPIDKPIGDNIQELLYNAIKEYYALSKLNPQELEVESKRVTEKSKNTNNAWLGLSYSLLCRERNLDADIYLSTLDLAAKYGIRQAMSLKAKLIEEQGIRSKEDANEAFIWYERAAKCGDEFAIRRLYELYTGKQDWLINDNPNAIDQLTYYLSYYSDGNACWRMVGLSLTNKDSRKITLSHMQRGARYGNTSCQNSLMLYSLYYPDEKALLNQHFNKKVEDEAKVYSSNATSLLLNIIVNNKKMASEVSSWNAFLTQNPMPWSKYFDKQPKLENAIDPTLAFKRLDDFSSGQLKLNQLFPQDVMLMSHKLENEELDHAELLLAAELYMRGIPGYLFADQQQAISILAKDSDNTDQTIKSLIARYTLFQYSLKTNQLIERAQQFLAESSENIDTKAALAILQIPNAKSNKQLAQILAPILESANQGSTFAMNSLLAIAKQGIVDIDNLNEINTILEALIQTDPAIGYYRKAESIGLPSESVYRSDAIANLKKSAEYGYPRSYYELFLFEVYLESQGEVNADLNLLRMGSYSSSPDPSELIASTLFSSNDFETASAFYHRAAILGHNEAQAVFLVLEDLNYIDSEKFNIPAFDSQLKQGRFKNKTFELFMLHLMNNFYDR